MYEAQVKKEISSRMHVYCVRHLDVGNAQDKLRGISLNAGNLLRKSQFSSGKSGEPALAKPPISAAGKAHEEWAGLKNQFHTSTMQQHLVNAFMKLIDYSRVA